MSDGWSAYPGPTSGSGRAPLGPDAIASDGTVVVVGAVCDVRRVDPSTGDVSLALSEYLQLESGKRVVLHSDRGVTVGARGGASSHFTEGQLRELALGALLPDEEDEDAGEPHPWTWLAELAARRGVNVTPEALRSVPYELELRPAARELVRPD